MEKRPPLRTRLRALAGDANFAWQERVWDRVLRRPVCPLLPALCSDPALAGRPVAQELDLVFRRVVGRRLTRHVVGGHPRRQSLTDFIQRGASHAQRILPYVRPHETLLEFGGGVGRLGRSIAPHVQRLVSVDIEPLLKEYGRRFSPAIEFQDCDELAESAVFDGAYSIAVFFHLSPVQQGQALEYVHRRLKAGGWFLVDLKIGPRTTPEIRRHDNTAFTALEDFRALYEPLFTATRVPLFYSGFLLRKRGGNAPAEARSLEP